MTRIDSEIYCICTVIAEDQIKRRDVVHIQAQAKLAQRIASTVSRTTTKYTRGKVSLRRKGKGGIHLMNGYKNSVN